MDQKVYDDFYKRDNTSQHLHDLNKNLIDLYERIVEIPFEEKDAKDDDGNDVKVLTPVRQLTEDDLQAIEEALSEASPHVMQSILTRINALKAEVDNYHAAKAEQVQLQAQQEALEAAGTTEEQDVSS